MKSFLLLAVATISGAGAVLVAQTAMKPGHDASRRTAISRPYMSAQDIQAALAQLDPALVASRTGGAIEFAKGKAPGVVRRRMTGPQYRHHSHADARIHHRDQGHGNDGDRRHADSTDD